MWYFYYLKKNIYENSDKKQYNESKIYEKKI